jgi:peptidoglycan/LPS O-acetylase OafA/YrhL
LISTAAVTKKERILPSLEGLRLFASLAIVAIHYSKYLDLETPGFEVAVDLFFVISGIVIAMGYEARIYDASSYLDFVRRRVGRLYPLHLATLCFYIAIGILVWKHLAVPNQAEKYDAALIVPNLLMVHAWSPFGRISFNYVSWSISAEFFVYLLFPLLLLAVTRSFLSGLAAVASMLVAAIFISEVFLGERLPELNWNLGALRAIPSFMLGIWLWIHHVRLSKARYVREFARPAFAISGAMIVALIMVYPNDYAILASVYVLVSSAFLCDVLGFKTLASSKPFSDRGYLTYSIYMLHTVVSTFLLSFVFPRFFGKSQLALYLAVICACIATYLLAELSYWKFEKPLRDRINSIGKARRALDAKSEI